MSYYTPSQRELNREKICKDGKSFDAMKFVGVLQLMKAAYDLAISDAVIGGYHTLDVFE